MFLVAVTYMEVSYVQSLTRAASAEGVACGWWWSVSVILLLEALYRPLAVKLNGAPAPLISLGNTALRGYLVAVFSVLSTIEMVQQGHRAQLGFLIGMGALGACYLVFKLSVEAIRGARRPLVSEPAEPEQLSLPFV
jgi:hypothetical protein